jgi:N-acetylneuraminic acid mutarotase
MFDSHRRPCARSLAAIEPLESRRLLANFAVTINFQPEDVGPVQFTRADFGRPFALRGNGISYGWSRDLEAAGDMVDRDSTRDVIGLSEGGRIGNGTDDPSVDERFDTFAQVEDGDEWSIHVPNGTYAVALVAGDPDFQGPFGDQLHVWTVNGEPVMDARPLPSFPWGEGITFVEVTDERITLRADEAGNNATLSWLRITQIAELPAPQQGESIEWEISEEVPSPVRRVEGGYAQVGDQFFVIGGFGESYASVYHRVDILDLQTSTWSVGADLPAAAAETHMGFAADVARGHIYWISGQVGTGESGISFQTTPSVWRYVIAEDRWERYVDLPAERYGGAAAVVGNQLFFFGGNDTSRVVARGDGWKIDLTQEPADTDGDDVPDSPAWQPIALMPVPGDHLNADPLNGKIYVTGSEHGHGVSYVQQRELQIYDVASDAWSLGAPLPTASSHNRSLVHDGRIWVFGGQRETQLVLDQVRSYDPATNSWKLHEPMPETRKAGYVFFKDDKFFYVAGDAFLRGFPLRTLIGTLQ